MRSRRLALRGRHRRPLRSDAQRRVRPHLNDRRTGWVFTRTVRNNACTTSSPGSASVTEIPHVDTGLDFMSAPCFSTSRSSAGPKDNGIYFTCCLHKKNH